MSGRSPAQPTQGLGMLPRVQRRPRTPEGQEARGPPKAAARTAPASWNWPARPAPGHPQPQGGKPCSVHSRADQRPLGTKVLASGSLLVPGAPSCEPCTWPPEGSGPEGRWRRGSLTGETGWARVGPSPAASALLGTWELRVHGKGVQSVGDCDSGRVRRGSPGGSGGDWGQGTQDVQPRMASLG